MKELILQTMEDTALTLKRGERVRWVSVLERGWRTQKQITITLAGESAHFEWFIFVLGRNKETFPLDIRIIHNGARTVSRIAGRCVLFDSARVSFTANAIVRELAKGADTHVAFRTLLLSPHAHARTIPSLEIATDDVSAGHAASIDRLADDALFYCASRGLHAGDTTRLLTHAFLAADVPALGDPVAAFSLEKFLSRARI